MITSNYLEKYGYFLFGYLPLFAISFQAFSLSSPKSFWQNVKIVKRTKISCENIENSRIFSD